MAMPQHILDLLETAAERHDELVEAKQAATVAGEEATQAQAAQAQAQTDADLARKEATDALTAYFDGTDAPDQEPEPEPEPEPAPAPPPPAPPIAVAPTRSNAPGAHSTREGKREGRRGQ